MPRPSSAPVLRHQDPHAIRGSRRGVYVRDEFGSDGSTTADRRPFHLQTVPRNSCRRHLGQQLRIDNTDAGTIADNLANTIRADRHWLHGR